MSLKKKKSKKSEMILEETGSLLLSVLVILVLIAAIALLIYNAFFIKEKTPTERNFENMAKRIQQMKENTKTKTIITLSKDYAIISFNKDDNAFYPTDNKRIAYFKPGSCKDNCLCLCKKDIEKGCKNAECFNFDKYKLYSFVDETKKSSNIFIYTKKGKGKVIVPIEKTGKNIIIPEITTSENGGGGGW